MQKSTVREIDIDSHFVSFDRADIIDNLSRIITIAEKQQNLFNPFVGTDSGVYRSNFAVVRADKIACFAVNDYNIRLNNLAISRYIGGNPVALLIIICPLQTGHWS